MSMKKFSCSPGGVGAWALVVTGPRFVASPPFNPTRTHVRPRCHRPRPCLSVIDCADLEEPARPSPEPIRGER